MSLTLTFSGKDGPPRSVHVEQEVAIGRDPAQVDIVLESEYVSRYHCMIRRRIPGHWVFIHRGRNASRLEGVQLRRPGEQAILPARANLVIGGVSILLRIDEEATTDIVMRLDGLNVIAAEEASDDLSPAEDQTRADIDELPSSTRL